MSLVKRQRTLVVEDDPEMRSLYARLFDRLRDEGFASVIVENGERALDILRREPVDLILLDWNLPGISGQAVLRAVRSHPKTRAIGVLMVTGKCSPAEEIEALDSGADDHLPKPFDESVLLARLRSLGRRRAAGSGERRSFLLPGLEFNLADDLLLIDKVRVRLTPKEMGLLGIFLERPGQLHANAFLWDALWGYESERWEHLLIVTLSSLRRKLGAEWGARLKCHKGRGYAFEGPL